MHSSTYLRVSAVIFLLMAVEQHAHAYTDPGSGMLILQLLGSAALGALFYFQRARQWMASLFRRSKPEEK